MRHPRRTRLPKLRAQMAPQPRQQPHEGVDVAAAGVVEAGAADRLPVQLPPSQARQPGR